MFVRRKPNKSGKVSVQVVLKSRLRKQQVFKTIGCSDDADEIERLAAEGRQYIEHLCDSPILPGLDETENEMDAFVASLSNSQVRLAGPELIFGRLYDKIGYNAIPSEMFRHMVICRLFNPGSKLKTVDYLERFFHVRYDVNKIYRFLDNLYLRKCCFSKDGKHSCPQIFLGLLVASDGNPIGYEIYEGNISEGKTITPVVKALAERFGFSKPIVVADAGLLSRANITALVDDGYKFILGACPKSESSDVKERILALGISHHILYCLNWNVC